MKIKSKEKKTKIDKVKNIEIVEYRPYSQQAVWFFIYLRKKKIDVKKLFYTELKKNDTLLLNSV